MKVGERVRHVGWSGHDYGEIIELFPDGRCSVVYPDGSSYSGIRQEAIESVEVELEEQRRDQAKQQVISRLESGDHDSARGWYERECADWWPIAEFEAQRLRCIQIAEAREAALREQRIAQEAARREQLEVENRQQLKSQVIGIDRWRELRRAQIDCIVMRARDGGLRTNTRSQGVAQCTRNGLRISIELQAWPISTTSSRIIRVLSNCPRTTM
jgi:hypothetical protein